MKMENSEIFSRVALGEFITRSSKTSALQVVSLGQGDQGEEPLRNLNGEKLSTSDIGPSPKYISRQAFNLSVSYCV